MPDGSFFDIELDRPQLLDVDRHRDPFRVDDREPSLRDSDLRVRRLRVSDELLPLDELQDPLAGAGAGGGVRLCAGIIVTPSR